MLPSAGIGPGLGAGSLAGGPGAGFGGSSSTTVPAPGGVNVNVGPNPAAAAGLLGPGGIVMLLSSITPTRVLVLLNAVTDVELRDDAEFADTIADIACECAKFGKLRRIACPRPAAGSSESANYDFLKRPPNAKMYSGPVGMLEDGKAGEKPAPAEDKSARIPTTASAFFERVLKGEAAGPSVVGLSRMGLLTSGAGGPSGIDGDGGDSWREAGADRQAQAEREGAAEGDGAATGEAGADPNADAIAKRTKGLGKVYIEFESVDGAVAAQKELSGRAFAGRVLVTTFAKPSEMDEVV